MLLRRLSMVWLVGLAFLGPASGEEPPVQPQASTGAGRFLPPAQVEKAKSPRVGSHWAILIGVNEYLDASVPSLQFCVQDVRRLREALIGRCGYPQEQVLLLTDDEPKTARRPLRRNVLASLTTFLELAEEEDTVLIYFSGHGFLDSRGSGYLAPADCDPSELERTSLKTSALRDALLKSKAKRKLLILDCCHAGSGKSAAAAGKSSEDLASPFREARGLITLASCSRQQVSLEWPEKRQGLFSYYLVEGLSGAADLDRDGTVDADELYKYAYRNVRLTAFHALNGHQEPVRIIGEDVAGVFPLTAHVVPARPSEPLQTKQGEKMEEKSTSIAPPQPSEEERQREAEKLKLESMKEPSDAKPPAEAPGNREKTFLDLPAEPKRLIVTVTELIEASRGAKQGELVRLAVVFAGSVTNREIEALARMRSGIGKLATIAAWVSDDKQTVVLLEELQPRLPIHYDLRGVLESHDIDGIIFLGIGSASEPIAGLPSDLAIQRACEAGKDVLLLPRNESWRPKRDTVEGAIKSNRVVWLASKPKAGNPLDFLQAIRSRSNGPGSLRSEDLTAEGPSPR